MKTTIKKPRRTLKNIEHYKTPQEILEELEHRKTLDYKTNMNFYELRDRSLVSLLYVLAARVSEVIRLKKNQFIKESDRVIVRGIKLSKPRRKGHPRKHEYRDKAWLPLSGARAPFTQIVLDYLALLKPNALLFPFDRTQAWRITNALTGDTNHFHRAYGEDYLYEEWDHDILAVADYVKVEPRTLQEYIRKRYEKYKPA